MHFLSKSLLALTLVSLPASAQRWSDTIEPQPFNAIKPADEVQFLPFEFSMQTNAQNLSQINLNEMKLTLLRALYHDIGLIPGAKIYINAVSPKRIRLGQGAGAITTNQVEWLGLILVKDFNLSSNTRLSIGVSGNPLPSQSFAEGGKATEEEVEEMKIIANCPTCVEKAGDDHKSKKARFGTNLGTYIELNQNDQFKVKLYTQWLRFSMNKGNIGPAAGADANDATHANIFRDLDEDRIGFELSFRSGKQLSWFAGAEAFHFNRNQGVMVRNQATAIDNSPECEGCRVFSSQFSTSQNAVRIQAGIRLNLNALKIINP